MKFFAQFECALLSSIIWRGVVQVQHWRWWEYIFTPRFAFYGKLYQPFLGPFLFYLVPVGELEKVHFCPNVSNVAHPYVSDKLST